jgi:hypothetical protein
MGKLSFIYLLILFYPFLLYGKGFFRGVISFVRYTSNTWENTIVNFIVKGYYYSILRNPELYVDRKSFKLAIMKRVLGEEAMSNIIKKEIKINFIKNLFKNKN